MFPASELGRRENQRLNIASPLEGGISSNRKERVAHRAESSMVKVKLLEVHSLGASITGLQHLLHRLCVSYLSWGLKLGYYTVYNRDRISIHNVKDEQPKEDENSR